MLNVRVPVLLGELSSRPNRNGRNETHFRLLDVTVGPTFDAVIVRADAMSAPLPRCQTREPIPEPLMPHASAIERLKGMFLDMPGTRLSVADAARLSGVERSMCGDVLEILFDACFLKRGHDGTFTRRQADTVDR